MMKLGLSGQGAASANRPVRRELRYNKRNAPSGGPDRAAWKRALLAVLARPRPQQGVAFATLVVEQVGVDGRREGGVVELEREIVATFLGALRPGCADLGSAHKDSVARSFVVGGAGFRDDADAFGLQTEGDDLALEIVADLLERTDGSHVTSPVCVSSPRPPRPRWRSSGRGRSATHPPSGPQRSGGRRRRDFLASRGMGVAQGKKVSSDGVAAQTIEAQPVFGQIEPSKRPRASRAEPQIREKMAGFGSPSITVALSEDF